MNNIKNSIWDDNEYENGCNEQTIIDVENKIGISIPISMKEQLMICDGGWLYENEDEIPFENICQWTNSTTGSGILKCSDWRLASQEEAFDELKETIDLKLLVIVANLVESYLCLDYRFCGPHGLPKITYFNTSYDPKREVVVADTIDEWIDALIKSKGSN